METGKNRRSADKEAAAGPGTGEGPPRGLLAARRVPPSPRGRLPWPGPLPPARLGTYGGAPPLLRAPPLPPSLLLPRMATFLAPAHGGIAIARHSAAQHTQTCAQSSAIANARAPSKCST